MHIQAGQCGNQIGAKVRLSRPASCVPTSDSPREGGRERRLWEPLAEQREEPSPLPGSWDPRVPNRLPSIASLCSAPRLQQKAGGNPSDSHFHPFCAPTHTVVPLGTGMWLGGADWAWPSLRLPLKP